MSKRLEDFIKNNKEDFDDLEPSADLWARIEKHLPAQKEEPVKRETKTFTLGFVMRVARSPACLLPLGFLKTRRQLFEIVECLARGYDGLRAEIRTRFVDRDQSFPP